MHPNNKNIEDLKRKLRALKKFEIKIRFGNIPNNMLYNYKPLNNRNANPDLVWTKFFDLKDSTTSNVKYNIKKLASMTKDEIKNVINEYFYHMFYCYCKENGYTDKTLIDIGLLTSLGLPYDSDYEDVIKKFKELIKTYHPDNGGDSGKFLEIMESYNRLKEIFQKSNINII